MKQNKDELLYDFQIHAKLQQTKEELKQIIEKSKQTKEELKI